VEVLDGLTGADHQQHGGFLGTAGFFAAGSFALFPTPLIPPGIDTLDHGDFSFFHIVTPTQVAELIPVYAVSLYN
jgi:hypothetical protein